LLTISEKTTLRENIRHHDAVTIDEQGNDNRKTEHITTKVMFETFFQQVNYEVVSQPSHRGNILQPSVTEQKRKIIRHTCVVVGEKEFATNWTIGVLRFDSRRGLGIFLFTTAFRTGLGSTQPPIQWVPGALSLGVKRPGREADHSPPSIVEVKNAWSYTTTPQYVFMEWCLVKHRDNFTFTFRISTNF
jgi:hypothetical protein